MKTILYIVICCTFLGSDQMNAQDNNRVITLTESTIALFRCSITATNYTFYGLSSEKSLENVTIGTPIVHRAVTLRDLRGYTEEEDPKRLINEMGFVTVPLMRSDGSGIETYAMLNKREQGYESTGIGNDYESERFMALQGVSDKELRLVRIPGMNLAFAALDVEGELHLIPLRRENKSGLESRPARVVFAEVAKRLPKGEDVPH